MTKNLTNLNDSELEMVSGGGDGVVRISLAITPDGKNVEERDDSADPGAGPFGGNLAQNTGDSGVDSSAR